jgi:glycosyltransferase involved in cell wall biosynthesis
VKPRVLFIGHTRYDLPLPPSLAKKWEALEEHFDYLVLASEGRVDRADPRFDVWRTRVQKLESAMFYVSLPTRVRQALKSFGPHVLVAQSAFEGAAALVALRSTKPPRPKLVVEVHGDWRSAARLYGSPLRPLSAPFAERLALAVLRRADATRAVSPYTACLVESATGRPPLATFPTYSDIEAFISRPAQPLPPSPTALWVGTLERVKNPGALVRAWPVVASRVPRARLVFVGSGRLEPLVRRLVSELPNSVERIPRLTPEGVAACLDEATVLVLPSLSEGLPRVVVEAFSRGRPVLASAVGGIPDIVVTERNGLLIPPGDVGALEEALIRILSDRELAVRFGKVALADAERFQLSPGQYADAMRRLVDRVRREDGG